ncbi:hypothetical protein PMPD1_2446 [Paramixta manurensis]|uniref:Uncharacterized protein n=1 Tax=Paramixta manurensis TaxID=2740817 RepID=A0A6M8U9I6_9GAMM|nr:hypothetical protein PMPD1_2446 [Erwiniaceae bacterium PD-1]
MQKEQGFKKRYILVPVFFSLLVFGWVFYFLKFPVEQEIYKKVRINESTVLYITQASAGAMTSFSYHYYFYDAKKSDADFIAHVDDRTPFMITNDNTAAIAVKEGQVYLRVRGEVYSFRNTNRLATIHLDASPW